MADGFLGRWSRRKLDGADAKDITDAKDAKASPAKDTPSPPPAVIPAQAGIHATRAQPLAGAPTQATADPGLRRDDRVGGSTISSAGGSAQQDPAPLTLADTQSLTPDSDFKPFMARSVTPEVKNAAMKKLFADPHFNVMDRLDTYIDDYSRPDPIPPAMLRQMVGAKLLGLFDEEERQEAAARSGQEAAARLRDDTNNPQTATVAPSNEQLDTAHAALTGAGSDLSNEVEKTSQPATPAVARAGQDHDAHTDLRLQPDDAAPAKDAGGGAG